MASRFLHLIFGYEWVEQKINFRSENPDEWMHNGDDAWNAVHPVTNDVRRVAHSHRVIRLANALFTLLFNHADGFDVLRERFRTRKMRSCFVESEVASMLSCKGFQIKIIKESGRRGEDFDILAIANETEISVEVTSKIEAKLTENTIRNTLHAKRSQVSKDRPAVLYLHVPPDWMRDRPVFTEAITNFVRRSRRFNAFVVIWEEVLPFLDGGFPTVQMRVCSSHVARHPLYWAEDWAPATDRHGGMKMAEPFLEHLEAYRSRQA